MRFGITCPNFGEPELLVEMAVTAERAGWDGFFLWDHLKYIPDVDIPLADPWVTLGAIAARTRRMSLGPMVAALPRRRPWKVAREVVTLDRLSNGRAILGVGAGWPAEGDFAPFNEEADLRVRAAMLDEGLEVVAGLMSATSFSFEGMHYRVAMTRFVPGPIQQPRVPVWVACTLRNPLPLARAARWDGAVPLNTAPAGGPPVESVSDLRVKLAALGANLDRFDIVVSGTSPGRGSRRLMRAYERAGATWWLEGGSGFPGWADELTARIELGPPGKAQGQ